jgi:tetratricopeptide (TPR) repeat protein
MDQLTVSTAERPKVLCNIFGGRIGNAIAAVAEVIYFVPGRTLARQNNVIIYDPCRHAFREICELLPNGWEPDYVFSFLTETQSLAIGIEDSPYITVCIPGDCLLRLHKLAIDMNFFDVILPSVPHFTKFFETLGHPQVFYSSRGAILGNTLTPEFWESPESERPYDVVFCGSVSRPYYQHRIKYLERLLRLRNRYKIATGTGNLTAQEYHELLRKAKIVIEVPGVESGVNLRTFEAIQSGAMLMHETRNRAIEEFYTDRQEVVLFDETDFEQVLDYYLTHDEERIRIARQAQQRSINAYTMPTMAKRVIEALSERRFQRLEKKTAHDLSPEDRRKLLACSDYYARKYDRALHMLQAAVVRSDDWESINNFGVIEYAQAHDTRDAVMLKSARRSLHRALKLNPSSWVVRYNLLQLEAIDAEKGMPLTALAIQLAAELQNFIAAPDDNKSENLKGLVILDDLISGWRFEKDQYEDIYFAQAIERHPQQGPAYAVELARVLLSHVLKGYASIMAENHEHENAAEAIIDALRQYPEHGGLWHLLGEQFAKLERWREAAETFANSLSILPLNVEAELGFVRALLRLGEVELARQHAEDFMMTNIAAPERNEEFRAMTEEAEAIVEKQRCVDTEYRSSRSITEKTM